MMKQIVYLSSAAGLLSDDELCEILLESGKRNLAHHITGILLYSDGAFIQVIEGEDENIDFIYPIIEQDDRHTNLIKMVDEPIDENLFETWGMNFIPSDSTKIKNLEGYIKSTGYLLNNSDESAAMLMIKTFILTHKPVHS